MEKQSKLRWLVSWRSLTVGVMFAGVAAGAFFLGRTGAKAQARGPVQADASSGQTPELPLPPPSAQYTKGVVAYIYGTVPVTREELGEYLIARFGGERLEPFVNKRIIEYHCNRQGITCTAGEVEADLQETLKSLNMSKKVFEQQMLKARGKTLHEWKEDVIRPKILMGKLCRERVKVEEEDVKKGYEAYHGEKVEVQMILWPKNEYNVARNIWDEIRKNERAFDKAAREQASKELAMGGGRVKPFGRNTTGSPQVEKIAFESLGVGDVSPIIETPQGWVVVKLLQRIPADQSVKLEVVRAKLEKEIIEKKVAAEVPVAFADLRKQADPRLLFVKKNESAEELDRGVVRELQTPLPGEVPGLNSLAPK